MDQTRVTQTVSELICKGINVHFKPSKEKRVQYVAMSALT